MAIVVQQKLTGSTLEQHDQAAAKLGMVGEWPHIAPGVLFHYIVATDDGVEIIDICTARGGFETFAQEIIVPVTEEVGIAPPTSVEFIDVHNYNTAG